MGVMIFGKDFSGLDGQTNEIHDILRFGVKSFSSRMDDPVGTRLAYDARRDEGRRSIAKKSTA